jgi:aspartate/glutamate racemase
MKLEYSRHILEKFSNIKFNDNMSSWSPVVPCGRTDRHDKAINPFSQFLKALKNSSASEIIICRNTKSKFALLSQQFYAVLIF